ncbi:MAG: hypothetical protein ACI4DU_10565 [Lachnospiraceae bacterium]
MKKYIIIAGVNGAGKSTLYQTLDEIKDIPRVNLDDIVRESGDWRNLADVIKAGKVAVELIEEYFWIFYRTTLCGNRFSRTCQK